MERTNKTLSERKYYPVLFMIIVSAFFIGVLASFYYTTKEIVSEYQQQKRKSIILSLFDITYEDVEADYIKYITEISVNGLDLFKAASDGETLGYAFDIQGNGLWGKIDGIISLDPSLERIINFEIINQNETPGLGGRITESWFKNQFSDMIFRDNANVIRFKMVPEDETVRENEVKQVTGATSSSGAVVSMIYNNLKENIKILEDNLLDRY